MESAIARHLDLLDQQREAIFAELAELPDAALWYRPGPKVWSIGEHLDHTRVINCFSRRLMIACFPVASIFARCCRNRPYQSEINDPYKRLGLPLRLGWIWSPKYTARRPVIIGFLHETPRAEHAAYRNFFNSHDERLLGHTVIADPFIGALNLVQWLRVQGYHDAHHYERVRVRIRDPHYHAKAAAASGYDPKRGGGG
jgi:hypothetical protein